MENKKSKALKTMVKIFIFGGCPDCDKAKALNESLKDKKIECQLFDTSGAEGLAEAAFYHILLVPSVLIECKNEDIIGWHGHVPDVDDILTVRIAKRKELLTDET